MRHYRGLKCGLQRKRASLIEIKTPSRSFTRSLVTCRKSKMMLEYFWYVFLNKRNYCAEMAMPMAFSPKCVPMTGPK